VVAQLIAGRTTRLRTPCSGCHLPVGAGDHVHQLTADDWHHGDTCHAAPCTMGPWEADTPTPREEVITVASTKTKGRKPAGANLPRAERDARIVADRRKGGRDGKGMDRHQLASKYGLSVHTIGRILWENGVGDRSKAARRRKAS
jgi:hypothetical protein